MLEVRNSMFKR